MLFINSKEGLVVQRLVQALSSETYLFVVGNLSAYGYTVLIIYIFSTGSLTQYGRNPIYSQKHFHWQFFFFNTETYYKESLNLNYPSAQAISVDSEFQY